MLIDFRHFIPISSHDHFTFYTSFWINLPRKSRSDNKDLCRYSTLIVDIIKHKHTSIEFYSFYIIHYSSSFPTPPPSSTSPSPPPFSTPPPPPPPPPSNNSTANTSVSHCIAAVFLCEYSVNRIRWDRFEQSTKESLVGATGTSKVGYTDPGSHLKSDN